MTIDPILAGLVLALVAVAAFGFAKWWILRRPDPEVVALRAATKLIQPYVQAQTPEALAAARAREDMRLAKIKAFQDLAASLK
jgi:hypothetical protein